MYELLRLPARSHFGKGRFLAMMHRPYLGRHCFVPPRRDEAISFICNDLPWNVIINRTSRSGLGAGRLKIMLMKFISSLQTSLCSSLLFYHSTSCTNKFRERTMKFVSLIYYLPFYKHLLNVL